MARRPAEHDAAPRGDDDRFNATIGSIGFVVHRHKPLDWSIRNISNANYDILAFAVSGRARYECEGERFDATRGVMLHFPRGVRHSARSDPRAPWSFYSVGFALRPPDDETRRAFADLPRWLKLDNFTQISDYFRQLHRLWRTREPGYSMACRGLVLLLMQQYAAAAERRGRNIPHADRIERIVARMHANVGRVDAVGDLAAEAGLSESRFRLLFRELTGCSVTRYQNRLRITTARDLLASGHYSVGEVAEELGFRDVYYFSRLFKRFTGQPPSACRQGRA